MVVKAEVEKLVKALEKEGLSKVAEGIRKPATETDDPTLKQMYREACTSAILNVMEEQGHEAFYADKRFRTSKKIVDELMAAAADDPAALPHIQTFQQSIEDVIFYSRFGKDLEANKKMLRERVASFNGDVAKINELLWLLSEPANRNWGNEYSPEIIRLGSELAKEALTLDAENIGVLYTLAHLHELQGDFETAIVFQEQALALVGNPISKKRHEKHIEKLKGKLND